MNFSQAANLLLLFYKLNSMVNKTIKKLKEKEKGRVEVINIVKSNGRERM